MYTKITISGGICTGKTTLFWNLFKTLKWPTFSASSFFRDYARANNISLQKGEEQEEEVTKTIDYGMLELLKSSKHIVLEGWMSGIMADGIPGVLKVLLTSDESVRIDRYALREKVTKLEAVEKIREREGNLFKKLKQIYGRQDFLDPKNYDLIIDTSAKDPDEVLASVLSKVK